MDSAVLSAAIKTELVSLYEKAATDNGLTAEAFAGEMADIIAKNVVSHIQSAAVVSTTVTTAVTGTAGSFPVTGAGTGSGSGTIK